MPNIPGMDGLFKQLIFNPLYNKYCCISVKIKLLRACYEIKVYMKKLLIFLILPVFMFSQAEKVVVEQSKWLTNYDSALKKASKEKKNILIFFTGSDWCAPCKMLKKDLFETDDFKTVSEDYVLLYIDMPMNKSILSKKQLQHNKELNSKLNKKGAVPLMKILNPNGKELDQYAGYSMNGKIKKHINLLKKYQQ